MPSTPVKQSISNRVKRISTSGSTIYSSEQAAETGSQGQRWPNYCFACFKTDSIWCFRFYGTFGCKNMTRVAISKLPTTQFEGKPNIMLHLEVQWSIPETLPLKPKSTRNACLTRMFSIFNCIIFKKYFRPTHPRSWIKQDKQLIETNVKWWLCMAAKWR